jgi:hypothetical protein
MHIYQVVAMTYCFGVLRDIRPGMNILLISNNMPYIQTTNPYVWHYNSTIMVIHAVYEVIYPIHAIYDLIETYRCSLRLEKTRSHELPREYPPSQSIWPGHRKSMQISITEV